MKILKYLLLLLFIFIIPNVSALTVQEFTRGFLFNWVILFLVIFFGCWVVLQDFFKSSAGVAVIVALVVGIAGSFGILSQYGPIVPKLDVFVYILIAGLIIFVIRHLVKGGEDTMLIIIFMAIPIVWFVFLQERISYLFSSGLMKVINVALAVLLGVAMLMVLFSLLRTDPEKLKKIQYMKQMKKMR
ncbi:MAG: hypothetical protein JSW08_02840 [archaeon]|nr:MAG: hypothetical protein JSW08_02840 [archaeon]